MNIVALLALILAASALEICLSAWEHLWGLCMALGSFTFALIDSRLFLLGIGLLALHVFYLNLGSLRDLILTREARQRRGFIELMYTQYREKIKASIKHIS